VNILFVPNAIILGFLKVRVIGLHVQNVISHSNEGMFKALFENR